jgi:hypothetical protein
MLNRTTAGLVSVLLGAALLAGCSDGSDDSSDSASPEAEGSTSASSATASLAVPEGTELTPEGSTLAVGDPATLAWEPRQDTVGVIDVTVQRLERTTFAKSFSGFKITDETKTTSPYFVRGTITNTGETDLGKRRIPLYVVDGENRLVDYSSFGSAFAPCPSTDFPESFAPQQTMEFCQVYLVPDKGELTAVSFRPTQEVNPITWTGEVTTPEPPKAEPGKGKKGRKNQQSGS